MTLAPMFKVCPKCKKIYSWNPDVGRIICPRCGSLGIFGILGTGSPVSAIIFEALMRGKKK